MSESVEVPIAQAAMQLGLTWFRTRQLITTGKLTGRIDERGRYVVDATALEQLVKKRAATRDVA